MIVGHAQTLVEMDTVIVRQNHAVLVRRIADHAQTLVEMAIVIV